MHVYKQINIQINIQKGFTIVEVIISLSILSIALLGFVSLARFNFVIQEEGNRKIEAMDLSSEAIEIIRGIRNADWINISTLSVDTDYYLSLADGQWFLTTINPGTINDIYTRRIRFSSIYRDTNDNIASSGILDADSRKLEITTEWSKKGILQQVQLSAYLTNWNG